MREEFQRMSETTTNSLMHMTVQQKKDAAPAILTANGEPVLVLIDPNDEDVVFLHGFAKTMKKRIWNLVKMGRKFRPRVKQ